MLSFGLMRVTVAEHLLCTHICADAYNRHVLLPKCEVAQECGVMFTFTTLAESSNNSSLLPQEYICRFRLITGRSDTVFPECLSLSHVRERPTLWFP